MNFQKLPGLDSTPPSSPKEVQQFLGLINWFRAYILMCAEIAQPLSNLTRKDSKWIWGNKERSAHQKLLESLHKAPVLKHFEPSKQTYLYTDASDFAIGGWIGQCDDQEKIRSIFYYSNLASVSACTIWTPGPMGDETTEI